MERLMANTKNIGAKLKEIKREDVTGFLLNYALYFILGTLLVVVIIIDPKFASVTNIINIIKQASTKGILALGVAGLIVLAGTDLSIGRVMGFAAAVTASLVQSVTYSARYYPQITTPVNLLIPLLLAIVIATAFSLINGFGAAYLRMHPFIVTLGTQLIAFGCNCIYIERQPSGTAQALSTFERNFLDKAAGSFSVGEIKIPFVVIYFLICAVVVHIIWTRTKLGKNMFAVGGNEEAARVSGVSVPQTIMLVYLMAGICYGIAAFLETARVQSVGANTGINYELDAISACVIGGVSFFGGVGTIMGVVIGSILLQSINYSLYFLGVNAYMQYIIRGLIIIIAVAIDVRKYIARR
jgi:methyl-galactoside transport system permease protein